MATQLAQTESKRRPAPIGAGTVTSTTILGIDPGLDRTGYAVIDPGTCRVVDAGLVRTRPRKALAERVAEIHAGVEEILDEHRPNLVAVEDLFAHYLHPRTAILMGHVRGVVLLSAAQHGVEVMSIPATKIKKTLTGNGHAGKTQIQRAIMSQLGLAAIPGPPDVADALAIAWCAGLLRRIVGLSSRLARSTGGRK